jgi:prepilin-type N-terminal cleavage/methylation domain-containing protein
VVNSCTKRSGFSLIELIFAIVIIGITVVSIPILTSATSKGVESNLVQEAVFAASAQMNQVLSYRWDENSIDESIDTSATGLAKVINTTGTGSCDDNKLKPGHIAQALHRRCLDNNSTTASATSTFGNTDGTETVKDDIDDFHNVSGELFIGDTSAEAYKQDYNYSISVTYSDMNGTIPATDSDVAKKVTVTIKDSTGKTLTSLSSYTFNIGEVDYYKRMYP